MAKKKDEVVPTVPAEVSAVANMSPPVQPEIVIADVDFNELLELEKAVKQTAEQFDKISGNIERLKYDLSVYHNHEVALNEQMNTKRKELIRRYQIDEKRQWRIDYTSHRVVYFD